MMINSINTAIYLQSASGTGDIDIGLYYKVGNNGDEVLIGSELNLNFIGGITNQSLVISEEDINLDLPTLDFNSDKNEIFIYWKVEVATTTGDSSYFDGTLGVNTSNIDITIEGINNNSVAKTYNVIDVTNHIIEATTNHTNAVESDFMDDELSDFWQTNGYNIRGIEDYSPESSFEEHFYNFLQLRSKEHKVLCVQRK